MDQYNRVIRNEIERAIARDWSRHQPRSRVAREVSELRAAEPSRSEVLAAWAADPTQTSEWWMSEFARRDRLESAIRGR